MTDDTAGLYREGKNYYDKGETEEALSCFTRLFSKSSGFADARNMAGLIYSEKGDFENAVKCFEAAVKLNPNYSEASLNLAVTYNEMGKYSKAREIYKAAQKAACTKTESLDPFVKGKLSNMHAEIGDVYVGIGFLESAIDEYKKALNLRPDFVDVRTKLGVAYRDNGDVQDAVRELKLAKKTKAAFLQKSSITC